MGLADNRIPAEQLPECWSDDVRMNALFAPFRPKSSNPESWDMKMKFWSDMLRLWCRHKKDPIVSAAEARAAFQRKGRTPACLEIVVEECFRNGDLSPISKYQQILHNGPEGWIRWGARLAFKPAALAVSAVSFLMPAKQALDHDGLPKASIDSAQRFVLESIVEEQATALLDSYPAHAERVGSVDELMAECEWQQPRETFEILLGCLVSRGCAVMKDDVVKLADSPSSKASPVTESDVSLSRLLSASRRLSRDAERLSRDATRAKADASAALALGDRLAAKNHLRRKHKLDERVRKCEGALENVRQLLHTVRETETNVAVVDTYRMSTQAMKQNMQDGGLDEDQVHDTMDELTEVLDSYSEVEKALSRATDDMDAAELEAELQELLSTPGAPGGGTPGKHERIHAPTKPLLPSPPGARKVSERDFIFDGEEQMLHELNELSVGDASPKGQGDRGAEIGAKIAEDGAKVAKSVAEKEAKPRAKPVALVDGWGDAGKSKVSSPAKPTQRWYPRDNEFAPSSALDQLCDSFTELRTDQRIHPGQKLNVEPHSPVGLFSSDFQVQDHSLTDGVWLFNGADSKRADLKSSTEYFSSESPGKSQQSPFQMAPGGERAKSSPWQPAEDSTEDLQRRLNNLRGFN